MARPTSTTAGTVALKGLVFAMFAMFAMTTDSVGTGPGHSRDAQTSRPSSVTLMVTLSEPTRK